MIDKQLELVRHWVPKTRFKPTLFVDEDKDLMGADVVRGRTPTSYPTPGPTSATRAESGWTRWPSTRAWWPAAPMSSEGGARPRSSPSQVTPRTVVVVILTAAVALGVLYLLWQLRQLVGWCFVALFLAAALDPVVDRLQRAGIGRGLADAT